MWVAQRAGSQGVEGIFDYFQEGLRIPPTKVWQAYREQEGVVGIIAANTRTPDKVLGDLRAQAGDRAGDRLGVLYTHLYALRLAARRTLRALADGQPVGPEASVDKLLMSTAEQALFDAALDLLPESFSVDDDPDAVRWRSDWCYSRASSIYGGTAEIQRNVVAERLLKLPKGA